MKLKPRRLGILLAVIVLVTIGLAAWYRSRRETPITVRIIPSDLSIGTEKRLEPHLGLSSTAYFTFEIRGGPPPQPVPLKEQIMAWLGGDFSGPGRRAPARIEVILERWEKGKMTGGGGGMSGASASDGFVSISLKEERDAENKETYRVIIAEQNSTTTTHEAKPQFAHPSRSSRKLEGPILLTMGQPVAVWNCVEDEMILDPDGSMSSPGRGTGTLESDVETADWALVLKLRAIDRTKVSPGPARTYR